MTEFLTYILPVVVAAVATGAFEYFQKAVALLNALPAIAKQVIVALATFGLTKLAVFLGITLSVLDPTQLTSGDVSALISAGLAYVFHLGKQTKEATVAAKAAAAR